MVQDKISLPGCRSGGDGGKPVRPPKAVIFDMDGTLLDSMPAWHDDGVRFLAGLGIKADEGLGDLLFTMTSVSAAEYLIEEYHLDMTCEEVSRGLSRGMEDYYFRESRWKPGVTGFLDMLETAGIPMGIVTSTDGYCVRGAMERLDGMHYFRLIYSAGDMGLIKGEPEIFYRAARELGAPPDDTWVVEDGLYALETASAAGFTTVGVYDAVSEKDQEELRKLADIYVRDLGRLDLKSLGLI